MSGGGKKLIIMRGIPGSGKSMTASAIAPPEAICSADDYFLDDKTGEYTFRPHELAAAHAACLRKAISCVHSKTPIVIIDNTNIRLAHFTEYVQLAEIAGYEVDFYEFVPPRDSTLGEYVKECASRNKHGVGANACLRMASIWETRWRK